MFNSQESRHIQMIYDERAKNDKNSSTLAQTLEANIFTTFKGEHKFIYELLQNSDDSYDPFYTKELVETSFILKNDPSTGFLYLIFSHTGKHFSKNDVDKICDNGQQQNLEKSKNSGKIGYKGVGFKAVYSIAKCVHIISNEYNFRFDQDFFLKLQKDNKSYPWPLIPILNKGTEFTNEITKLIKENEVNFILQIREKVQMQPEMDFIKENRMLLLFLKNTRSITLANEKSITKINLEQTNNQVKKIFIDQVFAEAWLVKDFVIDIPEHISKFLNTLQDLECPQRLKTAQKIKVSFMAKIDENNKIIPNEINYLFCYLPTQINCGLPFVVNADFLLNMERSRLIDNSWNNFLMYTVGYYQLVFLSELSKNADYRLQIFKLLPGKIVGISTTLEKAFTQGFEVAITEVPFIAGLRNPSRLLKISETIVDTTTFYTGLDNFDFTERKLISNDHEKIDKLLQTFGSKISRTDFTYVINNLPGFVNNNINLETQSYIILFLSNQIKNYNLHEVSKFKEDIKNKKFILSHKNTFLSPEELFLPIDNIEDISDFKDLAQEVNFIHPKLIDFKESLTKIGVRPLTRFEFIKYIVKEMIRNPSYKAHTLVYMTRLIFNLYLGKEIPEKDELWADLKKLPIKTKLGKLKESADCYLNDNFQPKHCLENILTDVDVFISDDYFANFEEILEWGDFFRKLGIRDEVKVRYYPSINIQQAIATKPFMRQYIDFLKNSNQLTNHFSLTEIPDFLDIDFINHTANPKLFPIFWKALTNAWPEIRRYENPCYYRSKKHRYCLDTTYLQFCIRHKIPIPANTFGSYTATQLFIPALKDIIGDALPVSKFGKLLSEEQACFFGFKTTLKATECVKILDYINHSKQKHDPTRYEPVLKYLLKRKSFYDTEELKLFKNWKGSLLAQDNSLQPIRLLQYSELMTDELKGPCWLKQFVGIKSEMLQLVQLFDIVLCDQNTISVKLEQENFENAISAKNNVFNALPVIALMEANPKNEDPTKMLKILLEKFNTLNFRSGSTLKIKIGDTPLNLLVYLHKYTLYFEGAFDDRFTAIKFCEKLREHLECFVVKPEILLDIIQCLDEKNPSEIKKLFKLIGIDNKRLPKINSKNIENIIEVDNVSEKINLLKPETPELNIELSTPTQLNKRFLTATKQLSNKDYHSSKNISESHVLDVSAIRIETADLTKKNKTETSFAPYVSINKSLSLNQSPKKFVPIEKNTYDIDIEPSAIQSATNLKTGRLGEQIVYEKLLDHYQSKYRNCKFIETVHGFICKGSYINKKTSKTEQVSLEVIWYNKGLDINEDNGVGKDFTIIKNGIIRHIEVKSTTSSQNNIFRVTGREWATMEEFGNRYRIFTISGVNSKNPGILKIKNPVAQVKEGKIEIKTYELKF